MNTGFAFPHSESLPDLTSINSLGNWNESPIHRIESGIINNNLNNNRNVSLRTFLTNKLDCFIEANLQQLEVNGTVKKFYAPTGQDIINRNGRSMCVKTNHQCITRMREYELKSLEELRFEDYQMKRKFKTNKEKITSKEVFIGENKVKIISDSIQNRFNTPQNQNSNSLIKNSKNEMINYFTSLQNEINYRTEIAIKKLDNYRFQMLKDLETQKRFVIEDDLEEDIELEDIDDLNETIVKQNIEIINDNNNNLTIKNLCVDSLLQTKSSDESLRMNKVSLTDSTTSLTHITTATMSLYQQELKMNQTESIFNSLVFLIFTVYLFLWFILFNRLKVFR